MAADAAALDGTPPPPQSPPQSPPPRPPPPQQQQQQAAAAAAAACNQPAASTMGHGPPLTHHLPPNPPPAALPPAPPDALRETWRLASGGTSKTRLTREDFFVACKLVAAAQAKGGSEFGGGRALGVARQLARSPARVPARSRARLPARPHASPPARSPQARLPARASKLTLRPPPYPTAPRRRAVPTMAALTSGEVLPLADFHYDVVPDMGAIVAGGQDALQVPPGAIRVQVSEPTVYGSGLTKHTRYKVTTTTSLPQFYRKEMTVWRRFSDFEWLNTRLSTKFPATIIPLFPEKRLVGNTDADFVRDRMAGLEVFVDKVAHHAVLNASLDLLVFLDATDKGVEAAKRYIEEKEAEEAESMLAKGMDLVINYAVTGSAAPPLAIKADEEFVEACATHGAALARLSTAVKMAAYLDQTGRESAEAMANLGRALDEFASHESQHAGAGTAAATAVAAAKSSAQRSSAALFVGGAGGGGGGGGGAGDSAAAAAFSAHSAAAAASKVGGTDSMFNADFSDPYSAMNSLAPAGSGASGGGGGGGAVGAIGGGTPTEDVVALCRAVGAELGACGKRRAEQLATLEQALYRPMRTSRDQEAELGEAIRRRDGAIDKVQDANATLMRKKKALAALKPSDANYAQLNREAMDAVAKAEAALASRRDELDKMTGVLKIEMARVARVRRRALSGQLAEYARLQAQYAAARGDSWSRLLPAVSLDARTRQASQEAVSVIAHKAEEKARKASQVARQQKAQQGVGGSIVPAGSAGAGGGAGGMTIGGDDAPIPSANEL